MDGCDPEEREPDKVELNDDQDPSPISEQPRGNPLAEEYGLSPEQTTMFDLYL